MSHQASGVVRWWRIDLDGIVVCVLVTLMAYLVLVRPSKRHEITYQDRLVLQAQRTVEVNQARASLVMTRRGLKLTETELRGLPLTLEPATGVNRRLASLADLASRSGLEVHQMKPEPIRSGSRYDMIPITLSGTGDYRRVTSFLRNLHEGFADVGVVRFDLKTDNPGGGSAHFKLGLVWYTTPTPGFVEE